MPNQSIENFLGLDGTEIQLRITELERKLPTQPGTGYLKTILKRYDAQPLPFLSYLAQYNPALLEKALCQYKDYDGAENSEAVMELLREKYIIQALLERLSK